MMKLRTGLLLAALPTCAFAQVATISTSDMDNVSGTNIIAGLQNVTSQTYFTNDAPRTFVAIRNGNGTPINATFVSAFSSVTVDRYGTIAIPNQTVSVPSASTILYGPFPSERWNTAYNTVLVSLSTVSGVSATAVRVPR